MDNSPRLSGEEWQLWADRLLQCHYGPAEYQRVPDNHRGDAGIEGFSLSSGHAYQAYGPEGPLSTKARYEKMRKKMTDDLNKFCSNRAILSGIFGRVKIRRWVLLVPYLDSKEIVKHAAEKTRDVISAGLSYVDNMDFRVVVEDEESFAVEKRLLLNIELGSVLIETPELASETISEWAGTNDALIRTLDGKISRLPTLESDESRRQFRDRVVKHFLEGQNTLDELRKYPQIYENLRKAKGGKERYLATEVMLSEGSPSTILQEAIQDFRRLARAEIRGVSESTIEAIVWEAVSDWLIRCPLDFPNGGERNHT